MLKPVGQEQTKSQFLSQLPSNWYQGEHMSLIGPTGTGKTTLAREVLALRRYVVIVAVKRTDDTLQQFISPATGDRYQVIRKWPPDYPLKKVILWPQPKDIGAHDDQSQIIYQALNQVYLSGGWTCYLDEAGYIAGSLGLGKAIGVLLNQGRSAGITMVVTMTRPSSVIAQVPKEALTQCRHVIVFKYTDLREQEICAYIAGISKQEMRRYQESLEWRSSNGERYSDFLYAQNGEVTIVRSI